MADYIRRHDWAATQLGPIEHWPPTLRIALSMVLNHPLSMALCWGPDLVTLYNDAYRPLLGSKPEALGRPILDVWAEAGETAAPQLEQALQGEAIRFENAPFTLLRHGHSEQAFFNYTLSPVQDETGIIVGVLITAFETTEQVLGERQRAASQEDLRESQGRQAFLLQLSDALRAEPNADAIAERGLSMLSERLRLDRCYIGIYLPAEDRADLPHQVGNDGVPPLPTSIRLSDFPNALQVAAAGTLVIDDFAETKGLSGTDRQNIGSLGLRALVAATLRKGEHNPLWTTVAVSSHPRHWTRGETAVIEEAAERIWAAMEQARAATALRESEERFRQFAASSADAFWIRDAATLTMEYANPAIEAIYGVPKDAVLGDLKNWATLIVPEDRDAALEHVTQAQRGEAAVCEFRILRPSDGAFRWVRDTDFPLLDEHGRVRRIGGIVEDVTEAKQAAEHQGVLVHELQHRVRNTLAMIRSVADQTGDTASDVEDYRDLLEGRLRALARVQVLLTQADNVGVDLATLIRAEVDAQAAHESQWTLSGPELMLSPKAAEVLTLAIHELATNALKYGAFSHLAGQLAVTWDVYYPGDEPWLRLAWVETGALVPLAPPRREGFGTTLIRGRIPYELQGQGSIDVEPEGARCRLEFPLRRGDSILETDTATLSTAIAGGSLDMAGEADLMGCKVLVVEDDFFLAKDTERALKRAGGVVLGPVAREEQALALIETEAPTCALVDINLGQGAQFDVAGALQDLGVPFVFVTGYDDVVIPARFDGVERIRKPTDFRQVVRAAARLCAP
ncbi:PAS domain S-box protein [Methylobacterium sp. NMS14P]|uniref:PAS domain S-box protein n=1 Tax=Methylobacterium sp. NMS14P TaxID=2894310 RepID=UPI0023594EB2|nr:PAS domain S-box protein [Methylobacterium sp. NMS14P]WCS23704.1 PAS domain S-box protein [Methylobacterium sp. NMS14P]